MKHGRSTVTYRLQLENSSRGKISESHRSLSVSIILPVPRLASLASICKHNGHPRSCHFAYRKLTAASAAEKQDRMCSSSIHPSLAAPPSSVPGRSNKHLTIRISEKFSEIIQTVANLRLSGLLQRLARFQRFVSNFTGIEYSSNRLSY